MSELSDLLDGLLGSEAGKDSGGMDGLFDLLGGLMQSAPSQKKEPSPEEPPGAKAPDTADFEQILRIVSKLQDDDKNIRLLRALQPHLTPERAARTEDVIKIMRLANLLPLLRFSSGPEAKQQTKRRDDYGSLEQRRAFPGGISPYAGKCPAPAAGISQKAAGVCKR